jgi:hypothetical protein
MKVVYGILIAVALFCGHAGASEFAGVVKTTRGHASVDRAGTHVKIVPGTQISAGDRIQTGADGYVGLTLRDDTLLTIGPSSTFSLDTYRFDATTHDGRFLASLTKGVLSVVTGLIARRSPEAFAVKTRVSTMGVRGTEFIVEAFEE